MNMIDPISDAAQRSPSCHSGKSGVSFLGGRRGMALIAVAVIALLALALNQHWLLAAQLVPLLFLLPCMAMMFMCMKGHGRQQNGEPATVKVDTRDTDALRP